MSLEDLTLRDVQEARERIRHKISKSPLVRLNAEDKDIPEASQIYLKLENLQPVGSFKLRGALNAVEQLSNEELQNGVYTASAGNFSQGLAWSALMKGITCDVIVPDQAPLAKLEPTRRLGANVTSVPFDTWWKVILEHTYNDMRGTFIHPVSDKNVIAGNGTIGLEILDNLSEVDTILVPYGGGGLSCGIALAVKALHPGIKVFACEVNTAAPLSVSLAAGEITPCDYTPSFVEGIGSKSVLKEMWPHVKRLLDGSIVVSLEEIARAIKLMVERNHVVAEGAGASSVAAALSGKAGGGNIVCVVSGGNIDTSKLIKILQGEVP